VNTDTVFSHIALQELLGGLSFPLVTDRWPYPKTTGALAELTARYEGPRKHLFTDTGKLRTFVNVYVNDEGIRFPQRDNNPLQDNDVLAIIPSIAGGCDMGMPCCWPGSF